MRLETGFEEARGALATADAHRHHSVLRLATEHLVGDGADHARARHAEGVADGDRAAVRIELLHGNAELVAAVDHLRGESLVQLPHADVLELDAGPLEQLWDRVHGTDSHLVGLAPGHGEPAEDQLGLDTERLGAVHGHEHRGGSAVGELGGVARRHRALSAVLVEVGRQLEETLERGVSAVALVLVDVVILLARDLARLLVDDAAHHLERRQLFLEEAFLLPARRALLARQRVLVLGLAGDLVALGHDLSRVAHDHVEGGLVLLDPRVGIAVALHHADALEPAADGGLGSAHDDLVGGHGDGLEPRRAEAVDGGAGHADGKAARRSATRATLLPWAPLGWAQPMITSSISLLSSWGTLPSTSLMQWAARSSGRVRLNDPRNDLASGVRELATTTASLIGAPFWVRQVGGSIPRLRCFVPLPRAGPAVDNDGGAGHERGGLGGEEDARVSDLLHLAPAAHSGAAGHRVVGLLGRRGVLLGQHAQIPLGLHWTGRDAVDADPLAAPGHAKLSREVDHGGLGRAVVGHHRRAVHPGDGGEVDDRAATPLRHHLPARPLAAEEHAVDVDLDHGVPAVGADVLDLGTERGARVVDHDVEATHFLYGALDETLHRVFLTNVHHLAEGAAPEPVDLLHHGIQVLLLAAADHDIGARLGELYGDGAANAHAASGDDGNFPLE